MMDTYTEQHEYERLKALWKEYGNALIAGVAIGIVVLFGTKYWRDLQERKRVEASVLYEQLLEAGRARQGEQARAAGEKLVKEYDATPYAAMASLVLARQAQDAGDTAAARRHLEWAVTNARQDGVRHTARLRLARVLSAAGEDSAALALADVKDMAGFEAEYHELRGDVLLKLGRRDEARTAYGEALKHLREPSPYQSLLRMKLDDLGPGKTS
jgi:predicted negative regulator of RcsB-dependent stress response